MSKSPLKKEVIFKTHNFEITCIKDKQFELSEVDNYKKDFYKLLEEGRLDSVSFEDFSWTLIDINGSKTKTTLSFKQNKKIFNEIIALKCLIIKMIKIGYSDTHISRVVRTVSKNLQLTNGFSKTDFKKYTGYYDELSPRLQKNEAECMGNYLSFYWKDNFAQYKKFIESIPFRKSNVREIPEYEELLEFDYIISDFYMNIDKSNPLYIKFYPLLIWWKLTTIIPLRPDEFVDLKYDCIKMNNSGSYTITVPRKKKPFNRLRIPIINELKISKDMYNIINDYKSLQTEEEIGDYLFSYKTYLRTLELTSTKKNTSKNRRLRTDKIGQDQLRTLRKHFYSVVVKGMYESEITDIAFGDTRHLAFCNMMMQGLNPLSIARIGGHEDLRSQETYVSHLDTFAKSKVRVLSKIIKHNRIKDLEYHFSTSETYDKLIVRSKLTTNYDGLLKIQDGYCTDKCFPDNCIDDCDYCDNYIIDISKPGALERLKNKQDILQKEIEVQIDTMRTLSCEIIVDREFEILNIDNKESLLNLGNKLNYLFKRQSNLEANISIAKQFEEG